MKGKGFQFLFPPARTHRSSRTPLSMDESWDHISIASIFLEDCDISLSQIYHCKMYQAVAIDLEPPMVALSSHPRFPFELIFQRFI
jgi:hypothetical protein